MSRSDNKLSIRTNGLDVDLQGESGEVRRAYQALRSQLIEQFYQTMIERRGPKNRTLELPTVGESLDETTEIDVQGDHQEDAQNDDRFINLVICQDIYNKIYLVDEELFRDSFLDTFLRGQHVRRIYVDAELEAKLRDNVSLGSTLWRELTTAGKAAVGRSD
jgi:hypothetical protein